MALANGPSLLQTHVLDARDLSLDSWAAALSRILSNVASMRSSGAAQRPPSIAALSTLSALPGQFPSQIALVTSSSSRACDETTLRQLLPVLELNGQTLELLLIDEQAVPNELVMLQADLAFTASALPDRFAASAWLGSQLAASQVVELRVALQSGGGGGAALQCGLHPAVLHEGVCIDAPACVCQSENGSCE